MKRGNTTWSTFSYSSERKGANLRHTNSKPICSTKCQILEEKTVMRAKEATQGPGKRNMVGGCSRTLAGGQQLCYWFQSRPELWRTTGSGAPGALAAAEWQRA